MLLKPFTEKLQSELSKGKGKISPRFVERMLNDPQTKVTHARVTTNTRVCVITLTTGHDLVGYAQVLDKNNDEELIGQEIAYNNAKEKIWSVLGSIAKVL